MDDRASGRTPDTRTDGPYRQRRADRRRTGICPPQHYPSDKPKGSSGRLLHQDPSRQDGLYNRNYDTIAAVKGIAQRAISIESEIVQAKKGKDVQKYLEPSRRPDAPGLKGPPGKVPGNGTPEGGRRYEKQSIPSPREFSRPAKAPVPAAPAGPKWTPAARINRLGSIRPATLPRIGVGAAHLPRGRHRDQARRSIRNSSTPPYTRRKPCGSFEPRRPTSPGKDPADLKFDIIFLDGLHTFEQTFRDSAPRCRMPITILIIIDVFPSDVFSKAAGSS